MTRSSSASVAAELGGQPALVHHQHAVGHAEHLGQLAGDHQHGERRGRPARSSAGGPRPSCRRRCRASARRRSAASARSRATWRARPSAGCRPRGSRPGPSSRWNLSCSRVAHSRASAVLGAAADQPERARARRSPRQRRVAGDREVHDEALLAAVLGHEADARRASRRAAGRAAAAGRRPRRGRRRRGRSPKIARATSLRPGADEPGERDDLARPHLEADVEEHALAGEPVDAQDRLADLARPAWGTARSSSRPTIRRTISSGVMSAIRRVVHDGAVAHHGDRVADREDLVEAVRDEQHRRALLAQRRARPRTAARPRARTARRSARP